VLQQLPELAVGRCEDVLAGELAAALKSLRQLRVLELGHVASCFDRQCLLAVAGMPQLQALWLDGSRQGLAPGLGDCLGMLHRCSGLREVTLQRCGAISKGALIGLVSQPGMRQVVLRGAHGLAASAVSEVRALGAGFSCELLCEGLRAGPRCGEVFGIQVELCNGGRSWLLSPHGFFVNSLIDKRGLTVAARLQSGLIVELWRAGRGESRICACVGLQFDGACSFGVGWAACSVGSSAVWAHQQVGSSMVVCWVWAAAGLATPGGARQVDGGWSGGTGRGSVVRCSWGAARWWCGQVGCGPWV
jgi:hypothetical protein